MIGRAMERLEVGDVVVVTTNENGMLEVRKAVVGGDLNEENIVRAADAIRLVAAESGIPITVRPIKGVTGLE